jgi:UDP-glucuronate 4-epimerase
MTANEPIDVFNHGQMRRDFTYVEDVVAGILLADKSVARENSGPTTTQRIYNIGNNRPVDLAELIKILEDCLGIKAKLRYHDMQPGDVVETFADLDASMRDLNFMPRTELRQGIQQFVDWYREYHQPRVSGGATLQATNGQGV